MGRRFAHQRFADSRKSIRKKTSIFEALGQIRANHVFPPIRIQIRVICGQSSLLSIFWKVDSQKEGFFEARIDSQRIFAIRVRIANRFARTGPLRTRSCVFFLSPGNSQHRFPGNNQHRSPGTESTTRTTRTVSQEPAPEPYHWAH